jgi:hypothetical protein
VQVVVFDGFFGEFRVGLTQQLVVNADAVIGEGLAVAVVDALADGQEFEVVFHCLLVFLDVVVEHPDGVVGSTFVSDLAGPSATKGQHLVVFESSSDGDVGGVVDLFTASAVFIDGGFVECRLFSKEAGGGVEEEG